MAISNIEKKIVEKTIKSYDNLLWEKIVIDVEHISKDSSTHSIIYFDEHNVKKWKNHGDVSPDIGSEFYDLLRSKTKKKWNAINITIFKNGEFTFEYYWNQAIIW